MLDLEAYREEWSKFGSDIFYERYQSQPGIYLSMIHRAMASPAIGKRDIRHHVKVPTEGNQAIATIEFDDARKIIFNLPKSIGYEWIKHDSKAIENLSIVIRDQIALQLKD